MKAAGFLLFLIVMHVSISQAAMVCGDSHCVEVEVVQAQEDLSKGLMGRQHLGQDKGMLFVFNENDYHSFWMKNMRFALDIIWIDEQQRVIDITENFQACQREQCPSVKPKQLARYVLEVNAGLAHQYQWSVGLPMVFKDMKFLEKDQVNSNAM